MTPTQTDRDQAAKFTAAVFAEDPTLDRQQLLERIQAERGCSAEAAGYALGSVANPSARLYPSPTPSTRKHEKRRV
jgi:hypothetical protein